MLRRPAFGDVVAGITVALVAIPQAVAYARLAGLPAQMGVLTQIAAPIAAFALASSPVIQTGTTAMTSLLVFGSLSAVAAPFSVEFAQLAGLLAVVVGVVRLLLGFLRAGTVAYLLSQPVIVGFTSAAGVVICLSQVPAALGVEPVSTNPAGAAVSAVLRPSAWSLTAIAFVAFTVMCVVIGRRLHPLFPGFMLAVVGSVALAELFEYGGPVLGSLGEGGFGVFPPLPWDTTISLLPAAVVIAVIGFVEPTAIARRFATEDRSAWSPNKEFVSQGAANLASGLVGGYASGASFSRSELNRMAGARSPWSQAATGVACIAVLPAIGLLESLPEACLAGITIMASASLIRARALLEYRRLARLQWLVAVGTFILTIVLAPHIERAVIVGIVLAVTAHLWREARIAVPSWVEGNTLHLRPSGVLYFASAPGLEAEVGDLLARHRDSERLVVHLDGLGRVDLSGALALRDLLFDVRRAGLAVEVVDIPPAAAKIIERVVLSRGDSGSP